VAAVTGGAGDEVAGQRFFDDGGLVRS